MSREGVKRIKELMKCRKIASSRASIHDLADETLSEIIDFVMDDPALLLRDIDECLKLLAQSRPSMMLHLQVMTLIGCVHHDSRWDGLSRIYEQTTSMLNRSTLNVPDPICSGRPTGYPHTRISHATRSRAPVYFAVRVDEISDLYNIYTDITLNTKQKSAFSHRLFYNYKLFLAKLGFSLVTYGFYEEADVIQPYYLISVATTTVPTRLYFYLERVYYEYSAFPPRTDLTTAFPNRKCVKDRIASCKALMESMGPELLSNLIFHREWSGIYYLVFARFERQNWITRSSYFNRRSQDLHFVDYLRNGQVDTLIDDSIRRSDSFYQTCREWLTEEDYRELPELLTAVLVTKAERECHDSVARIALPLTFHSDGPCELAVSCERCGDHYLEEWDFSVLAAERFLGIDVGFSHVNYIEGGPLLADPRWQHYPGLTLNHTVTINGSVVNVPITAIALQQIGMYFVNALLPHDIRGYPLDRVIPNTPKDQLGRFYFTVPTVTVNNYSAVTSPLVSLQYSRSTTPNYYGASYDLASRSVDFLRFASYSHGGMGFRDLTSTYDIHMDPRSTETYQLCELHPRIKRHFNRVESCALQILKQYSYDIHEAIKETLISAIN